MSIIYEALKKTQERLRFAAVLDPRERLKLKLYVVFIFIALLGFSYALTILFYNPSLVSIDLNKKPLDSLPLEQKQLTQAPPTASKPIKQPSDRFVLKGIVTKNNEKVALINDEMLRKGEYIDGAYIINILDNKVYLDLGGKPVVLKIK